MSSLQLFKRVKYILLHFLLLLAFCSYGQHLLFKNMSSKDGLPGSFIYRVFEDSKGYTWYLSDMGIARFDGQSWKYFNKRDGFPEVSAFHIAEDKHGILWFITTNFNLYYYKDRSFHLLNTRVKIGDIDIGSGNEKWVLDKYNGNIYQLGDDLVLRKRSQGRVGHYYFALRKLPGPAFIVATNIGIALEKPGNTPVTLMKISNTIPVKPRLFTRPGGHILVTTYDGIYDFNPSTNEFTFVLATPNNEVISYYEDNTGVWLGTFKGLFYFPGKEISEKNKKTYLETYIISSIIKAENSYVFGTANGGVFISNFKTVHIDRTDGLADENIAFVKKENNNIYLVTRTGKFALLEHGRIMPDYFHNIGLCNKDIGAVISISDSMLYTEPLSGQHFMVRHRKVSELPFVWGRGLPYAEHAVVSDSAMHLFQITTRGGSCLLDSLQVKALLTKLRQQHPETFEALIVRSFKLACIANGRQFYTWGDGYLDVVPVKGDVAFVFKKLEGSISSICKIPGGMAFSTFNNGVFLKTGGKTYHYNKDNNLLSDRCSNIIIRKNNLWVITNKGLSRMLLDSSGKLSCITHFTTENYLPGNEVNDIMFHEGKVFVATTEGVGIFDEAAEIDSKAPRIYIEQVQVNNSDMAVRDQYELAYNQNNISLTFSSPQMLAENERLYKYIISGALNDTVYTYSNRVQFGTLAPGNYHMSFWAQNGQQVWSAQPQHIAFIIRSPFWRTWWFILIISIFVLLAAAAYMHTRISATRRQNAFKQKITESEVRSLRLYMNPHFIFNSLSSLQSYILTNQNERASEYIHRFSKLIRSVMEHSIKGELTLAEEVQLLSEYVSLEANRFKGQFDFDISVQDEIRSDHVVIPSLLIQPFVENAIRHGLTGTGKRGMLKICFYMRQKELYCFVKDNGHGRKKHHPVAGHHSTGIRFTEERIRLLINEPVREVVKIKDLFANSEPAGTIVEILIPIIHI